MRMSFRRSAAIVVLAASSAAACGARNDLSIGASLAGSGASSTGASPATATSTGTGGAPSCGVSSGGAGPSTCAPSCCGGGCCASSRQAGSTMSRLVGTAIDEDAQTGDILVAGEYTGAPDLGAGALPLLGGGSWGAFVVRYDAGGKARWSKGFGAQADTYPWARFSGSDVLIAATFNDKAVDLGCGPHPSGTVLARLAADGSCVFSVSTGINSLGGGELDATGNVVLASDTGEMPADCPPSPGPGPAAVQKRRAADGSCVWNRPLGGIAIGALAVGVDAAGSIYVGGSFDGTLEFAGATLQQKSGQDDAFLVKCDADGNPLWGRSWGAPATSGADVTSLAITADQRVWMVGIHDGPLALAGQTLKTGIFIAALTADGDVVTATGLETTMPPPPGLVEGPGLFIAAEPSGALALVGTVGTGDLTLGSTIFASNPSPSNLLLAEIDPAKGLLPIWSHLAGSGVTAGVAGTGQFPNAMRVGSCGDIFVTGWFSGTLDFGCGTLAAQSPPESAAWGDLFFAKLGP